LGEGGIPVTIFGNAQELVKQLLDTKDIVRRRKEGGWRIYEPDEEWVYIVVNDEHLCPVCASFGGKWDGSEIPVSFPDVKNTHPIRDMEVNERYPDVHTTFPYLRGQCRCLLHFVDYLYTLLERLMIEIEEGMI